MGWRCSLRRGDTGRAHVWQLPPAGAQTCGHGREVCGAGREGGGTLLSDSSGAGEGAGDAASGLLLPEGTLGGGPASLPSSHPLGLWAPRRVLSLRFL